MGVRGRVSQSRRRARTVFATPLRTATMVAVIAASVWASTALSAGAAPALTTVNIIADAGFAGHTPIWVGMQEGIFQKYGINANIISSTGAGDVPKVVADAADITISSPTLAVLGAAEDQDQLSILGTVQDLYDQQVLINKADLPSGVTPGKWPEAMNAVKGQNVCINAAGGSNDVMFHFLLFEAGIPTSDVHIDYTGGLATVVAGFDSGACNVVHAPEPVPAELVTESSAVPLIDLAAGQGPALAKQPFTTIIARESWVAADPGLAKRFIEAMDASIAYTVNPKHLATVTSIAEQDELQGINTALVPRIMHDLLETLSTNPTKLAFTAADLTKAETLLGDTGLLTPQQADIPASQLIPKFLLSPPKPKKPTKPKKK
jgi:ABC-type nitrate/sulfonate/bicarbonate transport system substrate-binding protein